MLGALPDDIHLTPLAHDAPGSNAHVQSRPKQRVAVDQRPQTAPHTYTLKEIYGIYDYDYVNHAPYGPSAVTLPPPKHSRTDVEDVVGAYMYLAELSRGEGPNMEPPPCHCCKTVNEHNKQHRTYLSTLSTALEPHATFSRYSIVLPPILQGKSSSIDGQPTALNANKRVHTNPAYEDNCKVVRLPASVAETSSNSEMLPVQSGSTDDGHRTYVTMQQRSTLFKQFGMTDAKFSLDADDVVTASANYSTSMERLKEKIKVFDADLYSTDGEDYMKDRPNTQSETKNT